LTSDCPEASPSRHVLGNLLPARRLRVSPGIVKRAISKYQARGPSVDRTSYKAILAIDIHAPPRALTPTSSLHGLAASRVAGLFNAPARSGRKPGVVPGEPPGDSGRVVGQREGRERDSALAGADSA